MVALAIWQWYGQVGPGRRPPALPYPLWACCHGTRLDVRSTVRAVVMITPDDDDSMSTSQHVEAPY